MCIFFIRPTLLPVVLMRPSLGTIPSIYFISQIGCTFMNLKPNNHIFHEAETPPWTALVVRFPLFTIFAVNFDILTVVTVSLAL